jgi:hypothetical protein
MEAIENPLQKIALQMKRNAAELNLLVENPTAEASRKKIEDSKRRFEYKGYNVLAALTIDTLRNRWAWHLSVCEGSTAYPQELPDDIVKELIEVILPGSQEIPSFLHPGKLRQFIRIEN